MYFSPWEVYGQTQRFKRWVQNEKQTKCGDEAGPSYISSDMIPVAPEDMNSSDSDTSSSTEDIIPSM